MEFDYLKPGDTQQLCRADSSMMMNITVERLHNETLEIYSEEEETAIVLLEGNVGMGVECPVNGSYVVNAKRVNPIDHAGYCLHVPRYTHVTIYLLEKTPSEILVQSTKNDREFPSQFYTPENTRRDTFGQGQFDGKAERRVTTYFDIHNAPYSNMVCGEIVQPQGGWSSYPPHEHPHPEVYYYRFDKPQGFGACFLDDGVHKIRDRSFAAIEGGKYHPQVTAPGYRMMYVWMIRHFDGYPWDERNFHPDHTWLLEGK
ncbi:MAG: 5-deoxy-glucuronate isomerase [Oscillospiraceae bacterium]|nr:5-deoxy-glucuronate isomerase [Oscillospiraceae bacterium]